MVKLDVPVMQALSLQDVSICHHHWHPKAGFDLFPTNLTLLFLSLSSSPEG